MQKYGIITKVICQKMKGKIMTKIDKDYIELQQLLKKENIVGSGGEAKIMIKEGMVKVNGEIETRRGRKLYPNDIVEVEKRKIVIE